MSEPNEPPGGAPDGKLNRRLFIAAVGAAAASSALFRETLKADTSTQYFYNSFGEVVPADGPAVELGIPVPPLPPGVYPPGQQPAPDAAGRLRPSLYPGRDRVHPDDGPPPSGNTTFITPGYTQNNILMIMVDQLRYPVWASTGYSDPVTAFDSFLPNIAKLRNHSTVFSNYTVAATNCTPSRATLLTGLYSQQTCMFKTQGSNAQPSLQTGFPTIGSVLTQFHSTGTAECIQYGVQRILGLSVFRERGRRPGRAGR